MDKHISENWQSEIRSVSTARFSAKLARGGVPRARTGCPYRKPRRPCSERTYAPCLKVSFRVRCPSQLSKEPRNEHLPGAVCLSPRSLCQRDCAGRRESGTAAPNRCAPALRQAPQAPQARPNLLVLAVTHLEGLAVCSGHRPAWDGHRMASPRLSVVLAMEVPQEAWQAEGGPGRSAI